MKIVQGFLLAICLLVFGPLFAQDESDEEVSEDGEAPLVAAIYIPLEPEFVVNYSGAGKLRYLKTLVTLRLADSVAAESVRHHEPFIRNKLVMLFAAQTDATLQAQEGREAMRQAALGEVRDVLFSEERIPPEGVVDVLFNALTWH